ncbi:MAG: hypothetical protein K2X27_10550 [Candidatus Obscuribacterales bacterium]|nr:hypothetical protein [Candidatus Obscuribacterales bacterium]
MTELKVTQAAGSIDEHLNQSLSDYKDGTRIHNLKPFIEDLASARQALTKEQYGQFIETLNERLYAEGIIPLLSLRINDVDACSSTLLVSDFVHNRGLELDATGDMKKWFSSEEMKNELGISENMVNASELLKADGRYSLLLPPGLNPNGQGEFKVKNYSDKQVANPDGTITHNISGDFNNKTKAINWFAYASKSDSHFKGRYTVTKDGKLIDSNITMKSDKWETNWLSVEASRMPSPPSTKAPVWTDLADKDYSRDYSFSSIHTAYVPLMGTYLTSFNDDLYTRTPTGNFRKLQRKYTDSNRAADLITHIKEMRSIDLDYVKRDRAGFVSEVPYLSRERNPARIIRDQNEIVIEVQDMYGATWNKLGENRWKKTEKDGKVEPIDVHLIVQNDGDIIFMQNGLTRIDNYFGSSYTFNDKGQILSGESKIDTKSKYSNDFREYSEYTYTSNGEPLLKLTASSKEEFLKGHKTGKSFSQKRPFSAF